MEFCESEKQPHETNEDCLNRMFTRIANSDAHFKHQQRGEPDLSVDEKRAIASYLYDSNVILFLSRFHRYLTVDDIVNFESCNDSYEVTHYIGEIKKMTSKVRRNAVKNRRFAAMKKMIAEGDYFKEESMKSRDPLLYDQLIGQYLTEENAQSSIAKEDLGFASVLMQHVQVLQDKKLYNEMKEAEECQEEEEEESSDEEQETTEDTNTLSSVDRQMLRDEFLRTMQVRFLNGEDSEHFDYRDVDDNLEFDSLDMRALDEEERYFDDDDAMAT